MVEYPYSISTEDVLLGASSISKRTTLGTIEIGGIQSGKETQSLEHRR